MPILPTDKYPYLSPLPIEIWELILQRRISLADYRANLQKEYKSRNEDD